MMGQVLRTGESTHFIKLPFIIEGIGLNISCETFKPSLIMREGIGGADGSRDVRLVRTGRGAFQVANLISARGFVSFKDSLLTCEVDKFHNIFGLSKKTQ